MMQRYMKIMLFSVILIISILGGCFLIFYQKKEVNYFDTIDATTVVDDTIYAVGRNNANDKELTKAKFTIYNNKQEKIYEKLYNRGYTSRFYDLLVDDENAVIVGGYEKNKKDYKNNNSTAVILKYDDSGQLLFEKEVSNTIFYDVLSFDDGYLAIGVSQGKDKRKGVLVKYHSDGTLDWKQEYGDGDTEFTAGVFYNNEIYVVGVENNSGILISFSKEGDLLDSVSNEETDSLGFSSITVVSDSLVLSGGKRNSDDFSQPLLVKYDFELNYIDSIFYDSKYSGRFLKVITDSNDDLIVLASTVEVKNEKNVHHAYIGKYRSDLRKASVVHYYNEDDYFTDISFMDGTYLVSGYSYYSDQGYLSKFLSYSEALKLLEVK